MASPTYSSRAAAYAAADRGNASGGPAWLAPVALAALRIVAGLMFMQHGAQKLLGQFGGFGGTPGATAPIASQMGLAGMLELLGGGLLVIGLLTRPVALLLSGMMAVAYFQSHFPQGFWPIVNRGELAALYCFVFLVLAAVGPGALSVDGMLRRRRRR